jgi:hypothetical protein
MTDNKDDNSKNSDFKTPTDLPGVKPEDYDASIDSGRGSAGQQKEDPARKKQKENGEMPLHEEAIGGA